MTNTTHEGGDVAPAGRTEAPPRALRDLGAVVDQRVRNLQRMYIANTSSPARALLAQLRNAVGSEPGAVPAVWDLTVGALPGPDRPTDDPTREENAAHAALTLYAYHQQSRTDPMHVRGVGLGTAVRRLAAATGNEVAVRRRFDAVATATSFAETTHHLRGLVTQLRGARLPLDYGLLADDLVTLQTPDRADRVRLRWAREYYRTTDSAAPTTDLTTASTAKDA